jgi:hypothetical protein
MSVKRMAILALLSSCRMASSALQCETVFKNRRDLHRLIHQHVAVAGGMGRQRQHYENCLQVLEGDMIACPVNTFLKIE